MEACFEKLYTFFQSFGESGVDIDDNDGSLTFTLPDGGTLLLTSHGPTQQIWLSSPLSGAHHFSFEAQEKVWQDTRSLQALPVFLWQELNLACDTDLPFPTILD